MVKVEDYLFDLLWGRLASVLDRIDRLHGRDKFGAALVEVVAAFVHRFAGESYDADGLG